MDAPKRKKRRSILLVIVGILLFLFLLFVGWDLGYTRVLSRPFKEKESLKNQTADIKEIEAIFWEQDELKGYNISNEKAIQEITAYLNGLTLIKERLTEEERFYNPERKGFYIYLDNGTTLSFHEMHVFLGNDGEDDCVGTNYYFYDSGISISGHREEVYAFFQDLLEEYAGSDGIVVS